eukprot:scaffold33378_cov36-Tisochrysis_lutea.AAC.2
MARACLWGWDVRELCHIGCDSAPSRVSKERRLYVEVSEVGDSLLPEDWDWECRVAPDTSRAVFS